MKTLELEGKFEDHKNVQPIAEALKVAAMLCLTLIDKYNSHRCSIGIRHGRAWCEISCGGFEGALIAIDHIMVF